ncbi:MAG: DUF4239 domain-containing protein, partial [Nitrospirota bacterium]|nr:DUF4239 domain-containing protein [Nitrospirota bacterium]
AGFTLLFFLLRTTEHFNNHILMDEIEELAGVPWLYSVIGLIFSILAAFVIQTEWEHYSRLAGSVKEEVGALEQLWHWSFHFPPEIRGRTHQAIRDYLARTIHEGLQQSARDGADDVDEPALTALRDTVFALAPTPEVMFAAFAIFTDLVKHHESRLHYASSHVPSILRHTILFGASLIILFSFFIGVKNVWLDYLFSGGLALLTFLVYLVMDDLDQPLRPGIWQLTTKDHQRLLRAVEAGAASRTTADRT